MKTMIEATSPFDTAVVPMEEARQTLTKKNGLSSRNKDKNLKVSIDSTKCDSQKSQTSSTYKELLSQPDGLSHRERLLWLQKRRTQGLWAQCDQCDRWRYLPHVIDRYELPNKWYCKMNPDVNYANCSVPEDPIDLHDEEDLIHSRFSAGSVVWAQLAGWPWWPAMVDDCPDTEQFYWLDGFSDIPTHYHVVFFDKNEVTRAWVANNKIEPYSVNKKLGARVKKHKNRLQVAIRQAEDALTLPLSSRLAKYSFVTRYKGKISSPAKVSKADLVKYRKSFKRKLNVDISLSSDTDTDEDSSVKHKTACSQQTAGSTPIISKESNKSKKIIKKIKKKSTDNITNDIGLTQNSTDNDTNSFETAIETNSLEVNVVRGGDAGLVNDTNPETLRAKIIAEANLQLSNIRVASPDSDGFDF